MSTTLPPNDSNQEDALSTKELNIKAQEEAEAAKWDGMVFSVEIEIPKAKGPNFTNFQTIFSHCMSQLGQQVSTQVIEYIKERE